MMDAGGQMAEYVHHGHAWGRASPPQRPTPLVPDRDYHLSVEWQPSQVVEKLPCPGTVIAAVS